MRDIKEEELIRFCGLYVYIIYFRELIYIEV